MVLSTCRVFIFWHFRGVWFKIIPGQKCCIAGLLMSGCVFEFTSVCILPASGWSVMLLFGIIDVGQG